MTIEYQLDNNIPLKFIPKHKSSANKYNYDYLRNNEVEYEWKCVDKNASKVYNV